MKIEQNRHNVFDLLVLLEVISVRRYSMVYLLFQMVYFTN